MERFAREWWVQLQDVMSTDKYVDVVNIHRFDPPSKYRGGAGVTGELERGTASSRIGMCVNVIDWIVPKLHAMLCPHMSKIGHVVERQVSRYLGL